jgi:hypothetical protein
MIGLEAAVKKYAESMKALNAAGDDPDRFLPALAQVNGARGALEERFKLGDPAIQVLATALTDEVIGGTATDPQARLAEVKGQIASFIQFYDQQADALRASGDRTLADFAAEQANRFRKLGEDAALAVPSAVTGRESPVVPGTTEGDNQLKREREQRRDSERDAEDRARSSRTDLIENELQKRLAEIEQEREKTIRDANSATAGGATPVTVNAINEQFNNEATLVRREAAAKAADQTAKLQLEAEVAALQANEKIGDAEKRAREIRLRSDADLQNKDLTDADRALITQRRDAEIDAVFGEERERLENEARQKRDQRRRLDISDTFTGSIATALSIGPPASLQQQQLNLNKQQLRALEEIRDEIKNGDGGIAGI